MESVSDIVQGLARQRGRGESNPLIVWHDIAATNGERVVHVPISQHLSQAWVKLTGDPFRPHQSQALTTLRRGDAIALRGSSAAGAATARLLLLEVLRAEPGTTALILLPDLQQASDQVDLFQPLNAELGNELMIATVGPSGSALHAARARIILTTPEVLHGRLLRYHDRIWQTFWRGLRTIWIDEAHGYTGVAAAHLAALLLRSARLRGAGRPLPQLIATLGEVAGAERALAALWNAPWRLVPVEDMPTPATALAVWRGGSERLRDASTLAQALLRAGYDVHLTCAPIDEQGLRQFVGEDNDRLSIGPLPCPAQVQILVGYPGSPATLRRAVASGAEATVLLLGDQPCDMMLARHSDLLIESSAPTWTAPPANPYVTRQQLLCAANEQPLVSSEIASWQLESAVERMTQNGQLVSLPGAEEAWQPRAAPPDQPQPDAYAHFGLQTASGFPTLLLGDGGQIIEQMDATAFDRWGFPGAVLPPGGCRYRITERDEQQGTLALRPEVGGRRTYPLRRCTVEVRDEHEQREGRGGRSVAWGRVAVNEEVYGFREAKPSNQPAERTLSPPLSANWTAHGVWIDVGITPATNGQLVGWSLVHALPLRVLCRFTDIVPIYDVASRRLFLVDAQPGGNGLSSWVYSHLEELLPLAYDIALDCRNDPLLEPMARADMDWLLLLLGGDPQSAPARERPTNQPVPQPVAPPVEQPVYARVPQSAQPAARVEPPAPRHEPPRAPAPPERTVERVQPEQPAPRPAAQPERSAARPERLQPAQPAQPAARPEPPKATAPAQPEQPAVRPEPPKPTAPAQPERSAARPEPPKPAQPPANDSRKSKGRNASDSRRGRQQSAPRRSAAERNGNTPQPAAPTSPDDDPLPPLPPTPEPEPAAQPTRASASAMIEKMRLLRQQREQQEPRPEQPKPKQMSIGEARFHVGDTIFCLPYGEGVVRESRFEDDGEILEVDFPDYGELTIDPAISLVRLVASAQQDDDEGLL